MLSTFDNVYTVRVHCRCYTFHIIFGGAERIYVCVMSVFPYSSYSRLFPIMDDNILLFFSFYRLLMKIHFVFLRYLFLLYSIHSQYHTENAYAFFAFLTLYIIHIDIHCENKKIDNFNFNSYIKHRHFQCLCIGERCKCVSVFELSCINE